MTHLGGVNSEVGKGLPFDDVRWAGGAREEHDTYSQASIVFDQAENRLHTTKAVMVDALGTGN